MQRADRWSSVVGKTLRGRNGNRVQDHGRSSDNRADGVDAPFPVEPDDDRYLCSWCCLTFLLRLGWRSCCLWRRRGWGWGYGDRSDLNLREPMLLNEFPNLTRTFQTGPDPTSFPFHQPCTARDSESYQPRSRDSPSPLLPPLLCDSCPGLSM